MTYFGGVVLFQKLAGKVELVDLGKNFSSFTWLDVAAVQFHMEALHSIRNPFLVFVLQLAFQASDLFTSRADSFVELSDFFLDDGPTRSNSIAFLTQFFELDAEVAKRLQFVLG